MIHEGGHGEQAKKGGLTAEYYTLLKPEMKNTLEAKPIAKENLFLQKAETDITLDKIQTSNESYKVEVLVNIQAQSSFAQSAAATTNHPNEGINAEDKPSLKCK